MLILVEPRVTLVKLFSFSVTAQGQQGSWEPLQGMNSLSHLLSHLGFWHLGDRGKRRRAGYQPRLQKQTYGQQLENCQECSKSSQPKRCQSPGDAKSLQALKPVQRKASGYRKRNAGKLAPNLLKAWWAQHKPAETKDGS